MESEDEWPERSYWREAIKRHNAVGAKLKEKMPDIYADYAQSGRNQQLAPAQVHTRGNAEDYIEKREKFMLPTSRDTFREEYAIRLLERCSTFLAIICLIMVVNFFISIGGMVSITRIFESGAVRAASPPTN